jgi:hypothetical protein
MWIVRKNNQDLTPDERKRLNHLFEYSPELKLDYTFREELTAIFEMRLTKEEAKKRLLKWANKVCRSVLTPKRKSHTSSQTRRAFRQDAFCPGCPMTTCTS